MQWLRDLLRIWGAQHVSAVEWREEAKTTGVSSATLRSWGQQGHVKGAGRLVFGALPLAAVQKMDLKGRLEAGRPGRRRSGALAWVWHGLEAG